MKNVKDKLYEYADTFFPDEIETEISMELKNWEIKFVGIDLKFTKDHDLSYDLNKTFSFYFPAVPELQVRITPIFKIQINLEYGVVISIETEGEFSLDFQILFEISFTFIVQLNLEGGVYFPPYGADNCISITAGVTGTIVNAKIGVEFTVHFTTSEGNYYDILAYIQFSVFSAVAYVKFDVKIKLLFVKVHYTLYLLKESWDSGLGWRHARYFKFDLRSNLIEQKKTSGPTSK